MNLSFSLVTLVVAISFFLAEEGEGKYIGKQHLMTELTDKRNADAGVSFFFLKVFEFFTVRDR